MNPHDIPIAILAWMSLPPAEALAAVPGIPAGSDRLAWHAKHNPALRLKELFELHFVHLLEADLASPAALQIAELLAKHDLDLDQYPDIKPGIYCRRAIQSSAVWRKLRQLAKQFFTENELPLIGFESPKDFELNTSGEYEDFLLQCFNAGILNKRDLPKFG